MAGSRVNEKYKLNEDILDEVSGGIIYDGRNDKNVAQDTPFQLYNDSNGDMIGKYSSLEAAKNDAAANGQNPAVTTSMDDIYKLKKDGRS